MEHKKEYKTPECTVVYFDKDDIITTSSGLNLKDVDPASLSGDVSYDLFFK